MPASKATRAATESRTRMRASSCYDSGMLPRAGPPGKGRVLRPAFARSQSQRGLRRRVFQLQRVGDRAVSDHAVIYVEAVAQMRVLPERAAGAFFRQREHERERHVVERE